MSASHLVLVLIVLLTVLVLLNDCQLCQNVLMSPISAFYSLSEGHPAIRLLSFHECHGHEERLAATGFLQHINISTTFKNETKNRKTKLHKSEVRTTL